MCGTALLCEVSYMKARKSVMSYSGIALFCVMGRIAMRMRWEDAQTIGIEGGSFRKGVWYNERKEYKAEGGKYDEEHKSTFDGGSCKV